jgi:hypothetical protein
MKFLWLISLVFHLLILNIVAQNNCPIINSSDSTGLYSASLTAYNNNFSGLLFFKKTSDSSIRVALTSEMGPKILDLELYNNHYKVNYAVKQLKKKIILKSLYTDFASIAGILKYDTGNERYFKYLNDSVSNSSKTVLYNKNGQELEISYFCGNKEQNADSIFLQHFNFKMRIELRKINF